MKKQFLYKQIYDDIKNKIENNVYKFGDLLPSEREFSSDYNVERGTVRKAIAMLVEVGLVEKINGVGTRVVKSEHNSKSNPSSAKNNIIGLVMADDTTNPRKLSQPYYADLFYHLERECKENNCQLIYAFFPQNNDISEFLQSHKFISIIYITKTPDIWISQAKALRIPIILVNDYHKGLTTISYDNMEGSYQVIKHLINKGHQNIAIITGPSNFYTSEEKLAGCYKAFAEYDMNITKDNIVSGNWEYQSGYDCIKNIFLTRKKSERPTAVFSFNDMMCIGAIRALQELSYSIPKDVSVVGFDNMEQLKYTEPNLTTVDVNIAVMANIIIKYVLNCSFSQNGVGLKILVPVHMIHRGTVSEPPK